MRFGVCCSDPKRFSLIKECGYDYVEMALNTLAKMTDEEYETAAAELKRNGMKAEAYNGFFVGNLEIVGPSVDFDAVTQYAGSALKKASALGGEVAVIGSGKARTVPDGFSREKAEGQFLKVLDICGNIAGQYGMKIVIEPLNSLETNYINTVEEGLLAAKKCGNPNVGCLADTYHVFRSGESLDAIENNGGLLWHVHLARGNADRRMPVPGVDGEQCKIWAAALKKGGYDARMSLEGSFKPYDNPDAAEFCRVINYTYPMLDYFR